MAGKIPLFIALGSRVRGIPEVLTLGVRPNFYDYTPRERTLIMESPLILYPTLNYAQFFTTIGKKIFPSLETYLYADDKIKQTTLYYLLNLPHPRTRIYYSQHHHEILHEFHFPFIAKLPRASSQGKGVFKIDQMRDLSQYLDLTKIAYVQEYLPHKRDLRVVVINGEPILAYWRYRSYGNFRANLKQGGTISFSDIPMETVKFAQEVARKCNFNDVGLDLIQHNNKWYLIEANMIYGHQGLKRKGLNFKKILREKLLSGDIADYAERQ